ncbi:hypothetical protein B0J13DRAFT_516409 [Dactylonectria estremocensis]|uniref:Zn(2)-C6 fungal-type domain-containing protein n=1 Tax=Dactylonectria estremocensis TaxID=1079267 RepID=A0A9P9I911_9HYPO|nr:hypothetical protein B0J13DRAFT_516409 [Dactylonectria estremocensis]
MSLIGNRVDQPSIAGVPRVSPNHSPASTSDKPRLRRRHQKSRAGCIPCKRRRVKCDESQPTCDNCVKREIPCKYFETKCLKRPPRILLRHGQTQDGAVTSPSNSASADAFIFPSGNVPSQHLFSAGDLTPAERLLKLRLFHHYLQMTHESTEVQVRWAFWIAEVAVQSPHAMDALLGFSACHLRRCTKSDQSLDETSHRYLARAIRSQRGQIQAGLDENNAPSIAATCALISFYSSVNRAELAPEGVLQVPLHWFSSLQMSIQVLFQAQHFIQDSKFRKHYRGLILLRDRMTQDISNEFQFLLEYPGAEKTVDEASLSAYRETLTLLSCICSDLKHATPLLFFAVVPSRFVDLVAAKDSRALAILGYFFMLVKKCRQFWWIDGVPEQEFATIMAMLPSHWWPVMSSAMDEFE